MENKKNILDYAGQVFMIFGLVVFCLVILCTIFGEDAKEYSTMFRLGNTGLSRYTLLQFLVMSMIIVTFRLLFFTDIVLKKASLAVRTIGMFSSIIVILVMFTFCFDWFPVNQWQPWVMLFVCFGISVTISTGVSVLHERLENQKMDEALRRLKSYKEQ